MKKQYETPELNLLVLKTSDFLSTSGDAIGEDEFSSSYGESFTNG